MQGEGEKTPLVGPSRWWYRRGMRYRLRGRGWVHRVDATRMVSRWAVDYDRVVEELTVTLKDGTDVRLWDETATELYLPRNYPVPWTYELPAETVRIPRVAGPKSRVTLRDKQPEAVEYLGPVDRVLALGCGRGKTTISLHAACQLGLFPLLIVVPTTALADQWRKRIVEHTTLREDQIGTLQGDRVDVEHPVTIGVLKSVAAHQYYGWVYRHFVLVIFDELHRLGGELLRVAGERFSGIRWGLSATPDREDGQDVLYKWHMGPCELRDVTTDLEPEVVFFPSPTVVDEMRYWMKFHRRLNTGRLLRDICYDPDRLKAVLGMVRKAQGAGRTVLVLGDRVEQLQWMQRQCPDSGLFTAQLDGEGKAVFAARREEALEKGVTFATSILAKEGLDRVAFDTLFILVPIGSKDRLQQTVGRILRKMAGKKRPMVLVVTDRTVPTGGFLEKLHAKMKRNMVELGYLK